MSMNQKKYRAECRLGKSANTQSTLARKARTRTLIQAGGLLEKSGLLTTFNLKCGDDLQKDYHCKNDVMALLGALIEMKDQIENSDLSQTWLVQKGKEKMHERETEIC